VNITVVVEDKELIIEEESVTVEVIADEPKVVEVSAGIVGERGLPGPQGPVGPQGPTGPAGESYEQTFETVSKNLKSWNASLNYTAGALTSIVYTSGADTITKTFNYTLGVLTSIVLSGDTPSGVELTKTLNYTTGVLTSISYS
jgi:hypothetical protein